MLSHCLSLFLIKPIIIDCVIVGLLLYHLLLYPAMYTEWIIIIQLVVFIFLLFLLEISSTDHQIVHIIKLITLLFFLYTFNITTKTQSNSNFNFQNNSCLFPKKYAIRSRTRKGKNLHTHRLNLRILRATQCHVWASFFWSFWTKLKDKEHWKSPWYELKILNKQSIVNKYKHTNS